MDRANLTMWIAYVDATTTTVAFPLNVPYNVRRYLPIYLRSDRQYGGGNL